MSFMRKGWEFIRDFFGFRKNSNYVKNYIIDANVKSSIYMAFVIIALEIWMIIRNVGKYVSPLWSNYGTSFTSNFDLLFTYIGLYILFIVCSIAVLIFAITYMKHRQDKVGFILNIVMGGICILWPLLLFLEHLSFGDSKAIVSSVTTITVYASMMVLGGFIIFHNFYKERQESNSLILAMGVISCFALVCLAFGIKVGYSDFANPILKNGEPNFDRLKMITCFLTMVIFVGCLLIWKPYFSILMLTGVFIGFMYMLKGYEGREFLEADEINYITFLVALTMITITIYQQRVVEAQKDEKLIHDAVYDPLIDMHNVRYLADMVRLNNDINPLLNSRKIYLFINIHNFRTINDQRGFEFGDSILGRIGKNISNIFNGDLVARQADDHYVVFAGIDGFEDKIEKLRKAVEDISEGLYIRLKVGGYIPKENESPNRAIDKARYACGIIKRNPEVTYKEYDDKMDDKLTKRQYIVNHLDEAIEQGWIKAYYQPVVWSATKELCGAEALARWIDPVYGFLSPADFIPVLEETRMIHKLDQCIIKYVCSNMRRAIDEKRPVVPVSINFSRLDFELMNVAEVLESNVKEYNIDRRYIHVEVTESALSNNELLLNDTVNNIRSLGYSIWLDDFGSGYSSLNVLKDFTFDVIKIDMTFLTNFEKNEKAKDVLDCIVQLASRLGMKTLTEGVETEDESEFLERIGCGRLQGYLFGKPYKLSDFEDKIEKKEYVISKEII